MTIDDFMDLEVYQLAIESAAWIAKRSARWPHAHGTLRGQINDSSSAVGAMIAEAWGRKSNSAASFANKLSEAEGEACETRSWLFMARRRGLITADEFTHWNDRYIKIGAKLRHMRLHPTQWCPQRAFRSARSKKLNERHSDAGT